MIGEQFQRAKGFFQIFGFLAIYVVYGYLNISLSVATNNAMKEVLVHTTQVNIENNE